MGIATSTEATVERTLFGATDRWKARRVLGRLRFSLLLGAVVLALQLLLAAPKTHRDAVRSLGINWTSFASGQIWRLVTDALIQDRPGLRWSILIPFVWVGVAEWHLGWRVTAAAYFVTDWLSTVPTLIVLRIASANSTWSAEQISRFDCGSSAAIYGTLGAFCASRRGPNAWIGPVLLVQTMTTIWLTNHRLFDVQHLVSIGVGLVIGLVASGRRRN